MRRRGRAPFPSGATGRVANVNGAGRWRAPSLVLALALGPLLGLGWVGAATAAAAGPPGPVAGAVRTAPTPLAQGATGTVDHWGTYFGDRTGYDDTTRLPATVSLPSPPVEVATSNSTEYALLPDGAVYAWGLGQRGQLGDGLTADSPTVPVRVGFPAGVTIAALPTDAMPYDTALAVDTTGHVWGWGWNSAGQLCLGNDKVQLTPVELPLSDVTAVAGAGDHALYDAGGKVEACGTNQFGDLGDGTTRHSSVPVPVRGLPSGGVEALVASYRDSGALMADGAYYDWGFDGQGQLGDGKTGRSSSVPVEVDLPLPATLAAQGGSSATNGQTLVVLSDGAIAAWGDDSDGQLGDGGTGVEASPVEVTPPAGVTFALLASGGSTSYGVTPSGDVYSWGAGSYGQIGNGGTSTVRQPVQVTGVSGITAISATALNVACS